MSRPARHTHLVHGVAALMLSALLLAGCGGGGKEISDVEACLKGAGLKVEAFDKERDKKVEEGVFAASDLTKGDQGDFTFAVAALVTSADTVEEFEKDTKQFSKTLAVGDRKLVIDSGTDDRYVWVVGSAASDERYEKVRACVEP